jgi:hypothetical protein
MLLASATAKQGGVLAISSVHIGQTSFVVAAVTEGPPLSKDTTELRS